MRNGRFDLLLVAAIALTMAALVFAALAALDNPSEPPATRPRRWSASSTTGMIWPLFPEKREEK